MAANRIKKWALWSGIFASLVTIIAFFISKDFRCSVSSLLGLESSICTQRYINVDFIVQTKEREPIPGATVTFIFKGAPENRITDSNGYVKNNIPLRENVEIIITKEGYITLPTTLNLDPQRDDKPVVYQLKKKSDQSSSPPSQPNSLTGKGISPNEPKPIPSAIITTEPNPTPSAIITVAKEVFAEGEPIRVEFSGLPGRYKDWITLVEASKADKNYGKYIYVKKSGSVVFDGMPPGEYEIRAMYQYQPSRQYNKVIGRRSITVK